MIPLLENIGYMPIIIAAAGVYVFWLLYLAVYRLYLSPLAKFPGPKIAALTHWYECYYDVFAPGAGMYMWEIEKMHQKYGPIVRINPYELHFTDFDFYDTVYASYPHKRDKWAWNSKSPDSSHATGFTTDHDLHKKRREAISPFFSKRNVLVHEPKIRERVDRVCEIIEEHRVAKTPVNLAVVFLAMCMDTIAGTFFAEDWGLLKGEQGGLTEQYKDDFLFFTRMLHVTRHFAWLALFIKKLPRSIVTLMVKDVWAETVMKRRIKDDAEDALAFKGRYVDDGKRERKTIVESLRDNEKLPPHERSLERLTDEAFVALIAGTETPSKIMALIMYHLMRNPEKMQRLRAELEPVVKSEYNTSSLEQLPYLSACINEGLRLHGGVIWRSQRLAPEPIVYKDWVIPAGTPLSSSTYFAHYNEKIFPNARGFIPERWLENGGEGNDLKKFLVAFGKGSRMCLGYNMAWPMMYLTLAAVTTQFEMVPFETDDRDVDIERDWSIPVGRPDTRGVRATVIARRDA